jgi:biotin carboxyl carrier protein
MKMEANIAAGADGVVQRIVFDGSRQVEPGDLLVVIAPNPITAAEGEQSLV